MAPEVALQATDSEDGLVLTVEEAARKLRIGRTKMFSLLKNGAVKSVLIDGSRRIPVSCLHQYVNDLLTPQSA